jgi:hypothetical protein
MYQGGLCVLQLTVKHSPPIARYEARYATGHRGGHRFAPMTACSIVGGSALPIWRTALVFVPANG